MIHDRVPVQSSIDRWARVANSTRPAEPFTDQREREVLERGIAELHAVCGLSKPKIVWADTIVEYRYYISGMSNDKLLHRVWLNPLRMAFDTITRDLNPSTFNRIRGDARLVSPLAALSLADPINSSAPLGIQVAGVMATLEVAIPRIAPDGVILKYAQAWCKIAANCTVAMPMDDDNTWAVLAKPLELHSNASRQLHSVTGPAVRWGNDSRGSPDRATNCFFRVNGTTVPALFVENRAALSARTVLGEPNLETKRAYMTLYGVEKLLKDSNARLLQQDDWGKLWGLEIPGDVPLVMVEVLNSTPEPDGTFKTYFMRVEPNLRPMYPDGTFGPPQPSTALNAIASTFGFTGPEYAQKLEFQS